MELQINNLESQLNLLNNNLQQIKGEFSYLNKDYNINLTTKEQLDKQILLYKKAVELLNEVQQTTRNKIKNEFETLVTFIVQFVTEQHYQFKIEFNKRGNLQELDFRIQTPDNQDALDMLDSCGGGVIDLVSFALRIVLMETSVPKTKGCIIIDEGFKHLSSNYMERIPALLEELSKKLKRQIIIISHESELVESRFNKIEIK